MYVDSVDMHRVLNDLAKRLAQKYRVTFTPGYEVGLTARET